MSLCIVNFAYHCHLQTLCCSSSFKIAVFWKYTISISLLINAPGSAHISTSKCIPLIYFEDKRVESYKIKGLQKGIKLSLCMVMFSFLIVVIFNGVGFLYICQVC